MQHLSGGNKPVRIERLIETEASFPGFIRFRKASGRLTNCVAQNRLAQFVIRDLMGGRSILDRLLRLGYNRRPG